MDLPGERSMEGQVAIVTGAARGLGREIAVCLANAGASIVAVDLLSLDETAAAVAAVGPKIVTLRADVTDEASVDAAIANVLDELGRLDVLVNNAGRWIDVERRPFWEIGVDEYDEMMAVNARSVFVCSRAAAEPMRGAGRGRIVNLASNVVSIGMPDLMHYVAAKAAVVGLTRSMASELGPFGICVNAVAPGLIGTQPARAGHPAEFFDLVVETQALKVPIEPADVAHAVAFLCGPGGRAITGQTITVNGGATMGAV